MAKPPAGPTTAPTTQTRGVARGTFVAVSRNKLGLFRSSTGRVERWLLSEPYDGMTIDTTAVDREGDIWVTLNRGPACASGLEGCGPKPDSCAGAVITVDPSTGAISTVLRAPSRELISDAQPSPDGRDLALLTSRCDRSYFTQHIRVSALATGTSWNIGAELKPCHSLGDLSWTPDGSRLVAAYGRSRITSAAQAADQGYGSCDEPAPTKVVVVDASSGQAGITGPTAAAQAGCEIQAVTATRVGYAAIEGCGGAGDSYGSGPVRLLRFSRHLDRVVEARLGKCQDGAQLRVNRTGNALLGSTYQYCNPPGTSGPRTIAFTLRAHRPPRTFYYKHNGGSDIFRALSW